jgi:hypothetical protein
VEGVGGGHRHAQATQQEVYRAVERMLGGREVSLETKLACAGVLRALGSCGGAFLWASSLAGFEAVKALCLAGLEDPSPAVRAAFAQALGQVAVAATAGVLGLGLMLGLVAVALHWGAGSGGGAASSSEPLCLPA